MLRICELGKPARPSPVTNAAPVLRQEISRTGMVVPRGSDTDLRGGEICGAGTAVGMLDGHGGSRWWVHRGHREQLTLPLSTAGVLVAGLLLVLAGLLAQGRAVLAHSTHTLPLVTSASNSVQQGFVRIINHSSHAGTVEIHAIDDSGRRVGPISLSLDAGKTAHFNSMDLEDGNPSKGLSEGVGSGEGDWRLELATHLSIEPLAYIRTADGFVTSIHEVVRERGSLRYHVPFINPGSNQSQRSSLRLVNPADTEVEVEIVGLDDRGERPSGADVRLTLPAGSACTIGAQELETGEVRGQCRNGFNGNLGDGTGKWQLFVSADRPIRVMSLLRSPTGNLINLSSTTSERDFGPPGLATFAPVGQSEFDDLFVGKRLILSDYPLIYWELISPGLFITPDETEEDGEAVGRYTYERTSPASGTIEYQFGDEGCCGEHGALRITFASPDGGTGVLSVSYEDENGASYRVMVQWRIEDIPTQSPASAPVNQTAFDFLFVGKRALSDDPSYYTDFVAPERFREEFGEEGGGILTGRYTYENTGPNSGNIELYYDDDTFRCTSSLAFDSTTTGTTTHACVGGQTETWSWRLVEIPSHRSGFAPVDQSAFDSLVVGKRVVTDDPSNYLDFDSPGRFSEVQGTEIYTGRYTYENTGPNSGTLELRYDDGDRCESKLAFDSITTGTFAFSCDDGSTGTSRWRLEDTPASNAPDLVVGSPTVSDSGPAAGAFFTLRASVDNQGNGPSGATTLRYYRSSDAPIGPLDTQVGMAEVQGFRAGHGQLYSISLTAPSNTGTYYYGACVDTVSGEDDTSNNCSSGARVTVGVEVGGGDCFVGQLVRPGESCTYPGTNAEFSVDSSGSGRFLFFSSGQSIRLVNSIINGRTYTFVATRQGGSVWRIDRVGS